MDELVVSDIYTDMRYAAAAVRGEKYQISGSKFGFFDAYAVILILTGSGPRDGDIIVFQYICDES